MRIDAIELAYLGLEGAASAFAIRSSNPATRPVLIECGPMACVHRLMQGIAAPAALFLTHIHLDHAGAAGHLSRDGCDIYVHPFGVKHLIDPAKLIASSRRVHGPAFDRWYGEPLACSPARVHGVDDGAVIEREGIRATALASPGHARHHHAWSIEDASRPSRHVTFAGDVAAMIVPQSRFISVPTPPPEFDHQAWRRSLDRLSDVIRVREDRELWLTHGGRVTDPIGHLQAARRRLDDEVAVMQDLIESGIETEEAERRYGAWLWQEARTAGVDETRLRSFLGPAFWRMNLHGVRRWLDAPAG
ncbi:MAG: MBL fold metallo-hydrolase [Phycisphaerae bacterium]|nr:MBL fold metallo-hydrolase [Phycisphaerae bacterium]